jgi:hypothetical protein
MLPHAFASESRTCGVSSQCGSGGDGNSELEMAGLRSSGDEYAVPMTMEKAHVTLASGAR